MQPEKKPTWLTKGLRPRWNQLSPVLLGLLKKPTWLTKGLRHLLVQATFQNAVPGRNRPDLRRDWDLLIRFLISPSRLKEETDLTYEGIETFNSLFSILLFPQGKEETDLTYEGIETLRIRFRLTALNNFWRNRPDLRRDWDASCMVCIGIAWIVEEETDLTYEGIETNTIRCRHDQIPGLRRNRPDLRRDWDRCPWLVRTGRNLWGKKPTWLTKGLRRMWTPTLFMSVLQEETDLTYEGIETWIKSPLLLLCP